MFVRIKKNRSGSRSVVIVDKSTGHFREIKSIGVSSDSKEIEQLCQHGREWIHSYHGQLDLFVSAEKEGQICKEKSVVCQVLDNVENILINGTQLILDKVYSRIGFDSIRDDVLKHLVIARLCQPSSKSGTVDYLKTYYDEDIHLSKIYRYLDKLYKTQKEKIQQISVEHTLKILGVKLAWYFTMLLPFILRAITKMNFDREVIRKTGNTVSFR